jgi:hypothetical protein
MIGSPAPKELPKEAKLVATSIVYGSEKAESIAVTELKDMTIRVAVVPGDLDPMLGPITKIGFSISKMKLTHSIVFAGTLHEIVNRDIRLGERKLISSGGTKPGTFRFITLTVSKSGKATAALVEDFGSAGNGK